MLIDTRPAQWGSIGESRRGWNRNWNVYYGTDLEGWGDLANGLIIGGSKVTIWVIGVIKPLTKSP